MDRDFQGIVLSGGKSRRFGEDKALAMLNGSTFLETAVGRLRELGLRVTVITNRARDYSGLSLDCDIQRDMIEEKGPLGGLYTACRLFPGRGLLVVVCDMPAVTVDSLKELLFRHKRERLVTLFSVNSRDLPFPGIYEAGLEGVILSCVRQNKLSMREFSAKLPNIHRIRGSRFDGLLANINKKEELEDYLWTSHNRGET